MTRSTTIGKSLAGNFRLWAKRLAVLLLILAVLPFLLVLVFVLINPPVTVLQVSKALGGNAISSAWVPLNAISKRLPAAVIASEDARFCSHNGVDWTVVQKVVEDKLERPDKRTRGASTITMQIAKNLFFPPRRSYVRKAFEVPLALWIDLIWSKRRQMEVYLNIVEWAPGVYGAQAAAKHHFKRSARKLSRRQAARLAVSLPNPKVRNAGRPGPLTRRLGARIERRMRSENANLRCLNLR